MPKPGSSPARELGLKVQKNTRMPALPARPSSAPVLRLAVVIPASVVSGAEERVPTGGELTLFEAVGPAGLTSFCCVARRRSGMSGVT
jgi:hypothetical protein